MKSVVVVLIGQFCLEVIGFQGLKVAVIGRLLFYCFCRSVYCLHVEVCRWVLFEVMYESFVECR